MKQKAPSEDRAFIERKLVFYSSRGREILGVGIMSFFKI